MFYTKAVNRRKFLGITGSTIAIAGITGYLISDKSNVTRAVLPQTGNEKTQFQKDEHEILFLASLAPSGHNTQPWFVKYIEPFHWIIGNDRSKWLPAVDPQQRETILSIGAFLQNLEYAANNLGYSCSITITANHNRAEHVAEVKLAKTGNSIKYDPQKIIMRRTVRSNYQSDLLKPQDLHFLLDAERDFLHYIPNTSKEHNWLREQTIEANRIQAYRDNAQKELAQWIRFSGKDARKHLDGLTTASMEIEGLPAWVLRNFYDEASVMKKSFREQSIDQVKKQVSQAAGWILITSNKKNDTVTLLETGKRMQRLFLKVRERNIAIHPMTQVLEETASAHLVNNAVGLADPVQFILRTGYVKDYADPVSLRRPVSSFIKT